jgi:hypothetical protein
MAGLDPAIHHATRRPGAIPAFFYFVIASDAKQSIAAREVWIASSLRSSQ